MAKKIPKKELAVDVTSTETKTKDCLTCDGSGKISGVIGAEFPIPIPGGSSCPTCNGTGKIPDRG